MSHLDFQTIALLAIGLAAARCLYLLAKTGSREPNLPPGPSTLPLLGNLASLSTESSYLKFTEWARTYGGVYSLKIRSETWIIVTSLDGVQEIMEKNGALTASRPAFAPALRFSGLGRYMLFEPYGALWRKFRKIVAELMKPSRRMHVTSVLVCETSQLLFETHQDPDMLFGHIQRFNVSEMLSVIAGQRIPHAKSQLCIEFFQTWDMISDICTPGYAPPVDIFPILNYIPDRFVRNWKTRCETIKIRLEALLENLVEEAEKRLAQDKPNGCFLEGMLKRANEWDMDNEAIRSITGALIFAGATTAASAIQFVIFLAAAFPEFQRKVQEEIDRVVDSDRAPTMQDLINLPYLDVFIREVCRFRPLNCLMVHYADEDQRYQGKLIPKGSTIFLNVWGIYHDPDLFENPETFDPDRFIRSPHGVKPGVEETIDKETLKRLDGLMWGAGRRKCPGMAVGSDTLAYVSASLLWAFEFSPPLDEQGKETKLDVWAFENGLTNNLLPFKLNIKPRSQRHMEIVKHNYAASAPIFEQFETDLSKGKFMFEIFKRCTRSDMVYTGEVKT